MAKRNSANRITAAQRAAHHEAGHAVACYSLRRRFDRITILKNPARGTIGHVPFEPEGETNPEGGQERRAEKRLEHQIVIHLAGLAATGVLTGRRLWRGDDLDKARQLARQRCASGEEIDAWLKWLLIRTENELRMRPWWRMAKILAAELLRHKQVSYTRACWLMDSTLHRK